MKIINVCNLKGGVAKTITSVNLSYVLTAIYKKKVLVIDNDKQGNASKFFGVYGYDHDSLAEIMLQKAKAEDVIMTTENERIDIIPANMNLLTANRSVMLDLNSPQQTRIKKALQPIMSNYDYCIIDNAPDINMSVINALVAGDAYIIPVKIDRFTFDGVDVMIEQAEQIRENFNEKLRFMGCLVTSFRRNDVNRQGQEYLAEADKYHLFAHHIRWTEKVDESTFTCEPVMVHSPRCGAAQDYKKFTAELLQELGDVSDSDKKGERKA